MYVTEIIGDTLASDCKRPCKKTTSTMVPGPRTEQRSGHRDVLVMLTQRAAVTTSTLDAWPQSPSSAPTPGYVPASGGGNGAAGLYSAGSKARTLCSSKWRFIYYLRSLIFVTRDQMNLWHLIQSIFPLNHQKSSWFKKPKYIFSARLTIGVKTNLMLKYHNNCCKMVPICLCWIWRGKSLG